MAIRDLMPFNWRRERGQDDGERPLAPRRTARDPWANTFDRMVDEFFRDSAKPFNGEEHSLTPRVNVSENDKQIRVEAELPGMDEKDIDVEVENGHLVLRGEKKREHRDDNGRVRRVECTYGTFERRLPLPDYAKPDKAKADYRNGVLTVTVPVDAKAATGKRIPVSTG